VNETSLDAFDYLKSMRMTEDPTEVHETDGGALWRIADGHFVLLVCKDPEHAKHMGPAMLRRVIPPHWEVFHAVANTEGGWEAHHYGPAA
jgi:hypothetical protein